MCKVQGKIRDEGQIRQTRGELASAEPPLQISFLDQGMLSRHNILHYLHILGPLEHLLRFWNRPETISLSIAGSSNCTLR